ncbi:hypothetical protein YC2023_039874 [Brassica napus]
MSVSFVARGRIQASQEESQQFPNPNEVVPLESNEQQRLLRISLRICGTVVESLPMARCVPKCEKTVQAFALRPCKGLQVELEERLPLSQSKMSTVKILAASDVKFSSYSCTSNSSYGSD